MNRDQAARAELERTTSLNPITGEVVDVDALVIDDVVAELEELDRRLAGARAFRQELADRAAALADRRNERTVKLPGGIVLEVNAPTAESYEVGATKRVLRELVDAEVLDADVVGQVIKYPPPSTPSPRVDLRELSKLKRNPKVAAALADARTITNNKRTAKVKREEARDG